MTYQFDVGPVLERAPLLLDGVAMTVMLSGAAIVFGTAIGIATAATRSLASRRLRLAIDAYVEVVRNTPFLVQIFLLYFGLPALGLRVTATEAALIGMIVNLGAYSTEIIRAGIESIHRSQVEAGLALGFTRLQIFRHVVLGPAIARVYPALCSQFVLMMLASSVTSAISTQELSSIAAQIDADTFRSFEVYAMVTVIYLALALLFKAALGIAGHLLFARRRAVPAPVSAAVTVKEVAPCSAH